MAEKTDLKEIKSSSSALLLERNTYLESSWKSSTEQEHLQIKADHNFFGDIIKKFISS